MEMQIYTTDNYIRVWFGTSSYINFSRAGEIIKTSTSGQSTLREPTKEEMEEAIKAVSNALKKGYRLDKFYVRFGKLPRNGKSKNYLTGKAEKGVSVIEAKQNLLTGEIELIPYGSPTFLWVQNRTLYEVSGEFIGRGSDGEPLLANAKIVRKIR